VISPYFRVSNMGWWDNDRGENMLKGVDGDTSNPPRLSDDFVMYCLRTSRQAREEFNQVVPTMLPAEQSRYSTLIAENPAQSRLAADPQDIDDQFQKTWNTQGVRTRMPQREFRD